MGSVGTSSNKYTENDYVRFGNISPQEESINWLSLSFDRQGEVQNYINQGMTPREAIMRAGLSPQGKFEKGVSAFKTDESGLPLIENAQQLRTFIANTAYTKGYKTMYSFNGNQIGTGGDNEPLLKSISSKNAYTMTPAMIRKVYETTFNNNYTTKTRMTTEEKQMNPYHKEFPSAQGGIATKADVIFYNGYKYENAKSTFDTTTIKFKRTLRRK